MVAVACSNGEIISQTSRTPTARPTEVVIPFSPPTFTYVVTFSNSSGEPIDLEVEIADTAGERSQGLMFREALADDAGMLFFYEDDHRGGFWMKDTFIPLSIAFVREDGTIIDIQDMEPETTKLHRPDERYRNAVEVNQGWFARNGIAIGDILDVGALLIDP
jgi:uncharacterized membrane protein (UPF0127 family)